MVESAIIYFLEMNNLQLRINKAQQGHTSSDGQGWEVRLDPPCHHTCPVRFTQDHSMDVVELTDMSAARKVSGQGADSSQLL